MLLTQRKRKKKVWLGELLVQKGLISPAELSQALAEQRHTHLKLGEILIQQGLISHQQLQQVLNEQRWRNVVTAVLLSVSAFVSDLPRLVYSQPIPYHRSTSTIITPDSVSAGASPKAVGGARSPQPLSRNRYQVPLQAYATVTSPLRGFCHPLKGQGHLSQGIRGQTHRGRMEYAYDLATSIGTPVYAMRAGKVIAVQDKYPDTGAARKIFLASIMFGLSMMKGIALSMCICSKASAAKSPSSQGTASRQDS